MADADNLDRILCGWFDRLTNRRGPPLIRKELADGFGLGLDGAGGGFLDEDVAVLSMLEGEQDQVDSFLKAHDEAGHGRLREGDGLSGADLVDPQGDDAAAGAHDVAVAGAADLGLAGVPALGDGNLLLQRLADAHGIDGIGRLVRRQADHALHPGIDRRLQHVVRADDIGLHGLHREKLAARHLLQRRGVEDIIDPSHRRLQRRLAPHVSNIELDLIGILGIPRLILMPHIILLLLIPAEDPYLPDIRAQEPLQHRIPERPGAAGDH